MSEQVTPKHVWREDGDMYCLTEDNLVYRLVEHDGPNGGYALWELDYWNVRRAENECPRSARNQYAGVCYRCGAQVEPGDGHFEMIPFKKRKGKWYGVKWRTQHAECAIKYRGTDHEFDKETENARTVGA